MSVNPKITVYIASHNYGRFLEDAIESVMRQSVDDWELIIIDDGSTDNTPQVIDCYRSHPKVRTFREEGIGLPAVCNLALKESCGDYIIRLDGDDVFNDNILLLLKTYLDRDPNLSIIFPDYYLMDESGEVYAHEVIRKCWDEDHLMDLPPNGACTMIRKHALVEAGGYREDLGAQDGLDLWVKLKDNHKMDNINLPLFYYRRHGNNLTTQPMRIVNARREIKKDATLEKMHLLKPVIAVIPCRRNYDFKLDLWNESLNGKSLLELNIEACLQSSMIDKIIVACDNPGAEKILKQYTDKRLSYKSRDEKSTLRSANIVDTLRDIISEYDPKFCGTTLLRYVASPFVSTGTIEEAITSLAISGADSASAIEEVNNLIYKRTKYGLTPINLDYGKHVGSESLYQDASTCVAVRNQTVSRGSLTGASQAGFTVTAPESFFISSHHDLEVAKLLMPPTNSSNT